MISDRLLDTRPLRASPAFRRLWVGSSAAMVGGQVGIFTVQLQLWQSTGSTLWVGAHGLVTGVVMVVVGQIGGTLADATDRRRLVLATSAASVLVAALLVPQAALGRASPAVVLALVAAQTAAVAAGSAARRSFVSRLLPRELVTAGVALNLIGFQAGLLGGPVLAGVVVVAAGLEWAYVIDAACLLLSLYGVARLPAIPPPAGAAPAGLRALIDGWRFVRSRPVVRGALGTDLAAVVLAMPVALFPAINAERFGDDPRTLALLFSAIGVGGVVATACSGPVARATRSGAVMLGAAIVWGLALTGFGLVTGLAATLLCLAVAGAADTVSVIARGGLLQLATPDGYRGRVTALETAVGAGGPGIGNARAGLVASLTSTTTAAVTGGLTCVAVIAAQAALTPAMRRWRTTDPPPRS